MAALSADLEENDPAALHAGEGEVLGGDLAAIAVDDRRARVDDAADRGGDSRLDRLGARLGGKRRSTTRASRTRARASGAWPSGTIPIETSPSRPAYRRALGLRAMLIGAHVSTAGGLDKAIERGTERGCESIQIFNQSPRMWRPTKYGEEDFAAFREAMDGLAGRSGRDPRRLPDQLRDEGRGAAQEVARLADPRAADRRRDRRRRRRPPPGRAERRAARALDQARREGDRRGAEGQRLAARCCSSRPPATKACSAATSTRPPS